MATAGGAAAAVAQATRASGVIVRMEPDQFQQLLYRISQPLIVVALGGVYKKKYQYLVGYRGLAFFTASVEQIQLPGGCEVVEVEKIWVP